MSNGRSLFLRAFDEVTASPDPVELQP